MCPVICTIKKLDNAKLTKNVSVIYAMPKLSDLSSKSRIDMGQCMCKRNCVRKNTDSKSVTSEAAKIYTKTLRKAA